MQQLSAAETISAAMERRPALNSLLQAFGPLTEHRVALPDKLAAVVADYGFSFPSWDEAKGHAGEAMLSYTELTGLGRPVQEAARLLLPTFAELEVFKAHQPLLSAFFEKLDSVSRAAGSFLADDGDSLEVLASDAGLPAPVLNSVLAYALGAVIQAAVKAAYPDESAVPWDERPASWGHGWCPVCGSAPSVAYLEEKVFDEKNAFVSGGGGKKHLHCGLCGTEWHFRRGACPACGRDDALELLRESGSNGGERLEWCMHCKSYCSSVDLRERDTRPDMDALGLSLMHLDMVAADKGLTPCYPTFWNQF